MTLYILLPAYNEADNLPHLFDSIIVLSRDFLIPINTVLIDDGSSDNTRLVVDNYKERFSIDVLHHEKNQGLGAALKTGLFYISKKIQDSDVLVIMDADNSHSPEYIPRLYDKLKKGYDVVIASRFIEGGLTFGVPFYRRIITKLASWTFRIFFPGSEVLDFTCGYRAYSGSCITQFIRHYNEEIITDESFSAMAEICMKILTIGGKISEVPFELHYEKKKGKSKMPFARTIYNVLKLLIKLRLKK
jgi:dolichol-phosphate mannosyltransferase